MQKKSDLEMIKGWVKICQDFWIYSYKSWTTMFTWLKQFIGIRLYIYVLFVYYFGSSFVKIKLCFDSLFVYLFSSLGDDSCQPAWGLPQSFFYTKPSPSPNVPIENIWAIRIHQAEVEWEGDHKPQLPEA